MGKKLTEGCGVHVSECQSKWLPAIVIGVRGCSVYMSWASLDNQADLFD